MRLPGFARRPRTSRDIPQTGESRRAAGDELILRFIVITADEEFYLRLQRIAGAFEWQIGRAASLAEAETLIQARPTPMVVWDRDSSDGNWRCALRRLNESPAQPCVLLASQVADGYLWQEIVRNHGYDILPKPAPSERLIRCLKFAWFSTRGKRQSGTFGSKQ
jgi:DNA-binding NtrC family response regulator